MAGWASYDLTQRLFAENLDPDVELFNDYHAQIVRLGKESSAKSRRSVIAASSGRSVRRSGARA